MGCGGQSFENGICYFLKSFYLNQHYVDCKTDGVGVISYPVNLFAIADLAQPSLTLSQPNQPYPTLNLSKYALQNLSQPNLTLK